MIQFDITQKGSISSDIKKLQARLKNLPKEALVKYVELTPIKSGNARRNTSLSGNSIIANYPYAERLDNGWSEQAPNGMTKPMEKWLVDRLNQISKG